MSDDGTPDTLWVDVSHHDRARRGGPLDWNAIRNDTSPVMCARASYGDPQGYNPSSPYFVEFQTGAAAAGFTSRGGYHNLIHGDAASHMRQADLLSRMLEIQSCQWGMADVEHYQELVNNNLWPRWDDVLRFRDAWYATERLPLTWYLPMWVVTGFYAGANLNDLPGLVIQSHYLPYTGGPRAIYDAGGASTGTGWDDLYGGRLPDGWQFTATADVAGASTQTDVNAFRGTVEQFAAALRTGGNKYVTVENDVVWGAPRWESLTHMQPTIRYGPEKGAPVEMVQTLNKLVAAAAADETRDTATQAAIAALTDVIKAGGGNADSVAIMARIDDAAAKTMELVESRHQQEMTELSALHAEAIREREAELAALKAELDRLGTG